MELLHEKFHHSIETTGVERHEQLNEATMVVNRSLFDLTKQDVLLPNGTSMGNERCSDLRRKQRMILDNPWRRDIE